MTPEDMIIGAEILAAVVMATVPEPWMKRMIVAMMNGRMMIGTEADASPSAM